MEDGPVVEEAVIAVTAAEAVTVVETLAGHMVAVSIHNHQDEAPLLSAMEEALILLYRLLYLLLFLWPHSVVFRHQIRLQRKAYRKARRTGSGWNPA